MNSSEVPAPLRQSSGNLVCDVCDVKCVSQKGLDSHYFKSEHTNRSKDLARCLFGYVPNTHIKCLDDLFNHPYKKGTCIGIHYVKDCTKGGKTLFACALCDFACNTMFKHIYSITHKNKYIGRHFACIFKDYRSFSPLVIEMIAAVIEQVEGLQKFKGNLKNPTISFSASKCSFSQTLDKVVELLKVRGIACENPYSHPNEGDKLIVLKPTPSKPSAAAQSTSRQGKEIIEKRQNQGIDCKTNCRQEKVEFCQQAGSHASATKEQKNITTSVPPKSSAASNITFKQVNDKRQNYGVDRKDTNRNEKVVSYQQAGLNASGTNENKNINPSLPRKSPAASNIISKQGDDKRRNHRVVCKDTCRNENEVPSLQTGTRASAINEKSFQRPLQFEPLEAFKRSKSELTSQYVGKPIISLSRPVPAPFSFPVPSGGVIGGNNMPGYNTLPATKLQTTSYVPPVNNGFVLKHTPSLWSSHIGSWVHQTTRPPFGSHFPSWPPDEPFYQSTVQGYGYSDQRFLGLANKSAYGQASSVSDVGKSSAFKDDTWRREAEHLGAQHLHTLGTMGSSVSSLTRPTSVVSLKQEISSSYDYISVDGEEWFSKSSSQPEVISVLSKEPSLLKSHQYSPTSEVLPPATTSTGSRIKDFTKHKFRHASHSRERAFS